MSSRRKATAFQQALLEIEAQEEREFRHIQTQMQRKQVHPAVSFTLYVHKRAWIPSKWLAPEPLFQTPHAWDSDSMMNVQEAEAGAVAARQAELSERQRELVSGLQKEHTVQAHAMDQQALAASRIVRILSVACVPHEPVLIRITSCKL